MHTIAVVTSVLALLAAGQDPPQMPGPVKEHDWLQQFVGEWESEAEIAQQGDKPPVKTKGSETVRSVGGFWIMGENRGEVMGRPFTGILTVGYDPGKKRYVGTWIDSMTSTLWTYEGAVDPGGRTLTLEAEGPSPDAPGKLRRYRDTTEIKDKNCKVLRSSVLGDDGKWTTFLTVTYTRKK